MIDSARQAEREAAHSVVASLVDRGILKRPKSCPVCQSSESHIEGHHRDYSKPAEVIWLCHKCHMSLHSMLRAGASHENAIRWLRRFHRATGRKRTNASVGPRRLIDAKRAMDLYLSGLSLEQIAGLLGFTASGIWQAIRGIGCRTRRRGCPRGSENSNRKIDANEALKLRQSGISLAAIGQRWGVSRQAVQQMLARKEPAR